MLLALAVAACFAAPVVAWAQPTGAQVVHGGATLTQQGNKLTVTTTNGAGSNHSAINWQSFSIPAGQTTQFNQPSASSTSINRVLGNNPSSIFGTLSSNGKLVLVNPAGIAMGAGAVVDTAGFTASTLNMSDADALAGRLRFEGGGGALSVGGSILARSGDVFLIAPNVQTAASALVQSPNGATVIAAGQKVELTGRGLEGIKLEVQAPTDSVVNLGTLSGDAVGIFAGTLKHSGQVNATAVTAEGGKVVLKAQGDALVDGNITAAAGSKGGSVDVFGHQVALFGTAAVSASGNAGGGNVRIGGDYQGANPDVPNAFRTYVGSDVTIDASAKANGDGGKVIVWADDVTRMYGNIMSRGGPDGGNGGFAEVSGKRYLDFAGKVDLRAPQGAAGTLLLDPNDIEIKSMGTPAPSPFTGSPPDFEFNDGASSAVLSTESLEAQLGMGNVRVTATHTYGSNGGSITVTDPVSWTGATTLVLNADSYIALNASLLGSNPDSKVVLVTRGGGERSDITAAIGPTGAIVQAGELILTTPASSGIVTLANNNKVGKLAADVEGLTFKNDGALVIGNLTSTYLGSSVNGVVASKGVSIETVNDGSITSTAGTVVRGESITLIAGGTGAVNLTNSVVSTYGSDVESSLDTTNVMGRVKITAGGDIDLGTVKTDGTSDLVHGGPILLEAGGKVTAVSLSSKGYSDLWAGLFASAGSGGAVRISAGTGIDINGLTSAGGEASTSLPLYPASLGEGGEGGEEGGEGSKKFWAAGGNGGNVSLSTTAGTVVIGAGGLYAHGGDGLSGGNGGNVTIHADGIGGKVTFNGSLSASGGSGFVNSSLGSGGSGGSGGTVNISATGQIEMGDVYARAGDSDVLEGAYQGARGGDVTLASGSGAVTVDTIQTRGGNSSIGAGGRGGDVYINPSLLAGEGGVMIGSINTSGGEGGYGGSTGGAGGNVTVRGASITLSDSIATWGGYGGGNEDGAGGAGGQGGNVELRALAGSLTLGEGASIHTGGSHAQGGWSSTNGGTGGNAGNITLVAEVGNFVADYGTVISAVGGTGGDGEGDEATHAGGKGGQGGTITISSTGLNSRMEGDVIADGGRGGFVYSSGLAKGGAGGDAGSVSIKSMGDISLSGSLYARGGEGYIPEPPYSTGTPQPTVAPERFGANGNAGTVTTEGTMHVDNWSWLDVAGSWNNKANLRVGEHAVVWISDGPVTNSTGAVIDLSYGSSLMSTGGSVTNLGSVRGSGMIDVSGTDTEFVNEGTVAPSRYSDDSSVFGQLTITGNYRQTANGTLQIHVDSEYGGYAGISYDQLVVTGTTKLGGSLSLVSSTVPAGESMLQASLAYTPMSLFEAFQPMSSSSGGSYDIISAPSAGLSGNFGSVSGPSSLLNIVTVGGSPVPTTAPSGGPVAPTPPPVTTAAPTVAPTAPPVTQPPVTQPPVSPPPTSAPTQPPVSPPPATSSAQDPTNQVVSFLTVVKQELERVQEDDERLRRRNAGIITDTGCVR